MADEIIPDDKDWTWVLERPCLECGFDASAVDHRVVGGLIRANATGWTLVLDAPYDDLRARSRADRWSILEYAAHVRDVNRLYLERLQMMLDLDDPLYPNWDQNVAATEERYGEQDPGVVGAELAQSAEALADAFDGLSEDQWSRPGRRSDGAAFTVDSFALYMVHDPIHHLWDVTSGD